MHEIIKKPLNTCSTMYELESVYFTPQYTSYLRATTLQIHKIKITRSLHISHQMNRYSFSATMLNIRYIHAIHLYYSLYQTIYCFFPTTFFHDFIWAAIENIRSSFVLSGTPYRMICTHCWSWNKGKNASNSNKTRWSIIIYTRKRFVRICWEYVAIVTITDIDLICL